MSDAILQLKPTIMSSGGSKYNDLYYSEANSSVSLLECTFGWQNVLSLPSLQFGSGSQLNIPIDQFIGDIVLHLRLPPLRANESICRGWGYAMLQSIGWTLGNSNSTQIVLQQDAILQTILAQTCDPEKRDAILRLGGEEQLVANGEFMDAYVILPLPMSTACGDKLPIDSTMLQSNIVINVQFNQNSTSIYGGTATHPSAFLKAECMLRQGKLSNQAASLRGMMTANPELRYAYPFILNQYYISPTFSGKTESSSYQGCSVDLNAFANGDLVGISFYVIKNSDKSPSGNNTPNPFNSDDISNLLVTFNGSTLFNLPAKSYKMTNMLAGPQSNSKYPYSVVSAGTTNPFISTPKDGYMVFLDFSRERSACIQSHFFNTFRMPNQILRVQFNTTETDTEYRLIATYYYNACADFQNGTSLIKID